RNVRCAARNKLIPVDAVVAPTGRPKPSGVGHNRGRRFTNAADHGQRAWQLAVPGLQRMRAGPAVLIAKPVVAAPDHVHQPAWRTRIRIVIDGEDTAIGNNTHAKWIPKTNRHLSQPAAIERALK